MNISKTLAKKAQVYNPGVLFRRPQENLLLHSENLEGNTVMMNLICIAILISLFYEKTWIKKCAVSPLGKRIILGLGNLSIEAFLVWKAFLIIPCIFTLLGCFFLRHEQAATTKLYTSTDKVQRSFSHWKKRWICFFSKPQQQLYQCTFIRLERCQSLACNFSFFHWFHFFWLPIGDRQWQYQTTATVSEMRKLNARFELKIVISQLNIQQKMSWMVWLFPFTRKSHRMLHSVEKLKDFITSLYASRY